MKVAMILLLAIGSLAGAQDAVKPVAVIYPLAIAGATGADKASADTCPTGVTVPVSETMTAEMQAGVVKAMTTEMVAQLTPTMNAHVAEPGEQPPVNAVVFRGCVVKLVAGNKGKRLFGVGGSSLIGVHVEVITVGVAGPGQKIDVEEKGRNVLPGVGAALIINATRSHHTSLDGDAERAADSVVKQYLKGK